MDCGKAPLGCSVVFVVTLPSFAPLWNTSHGLGPLLEESSGTGLNPRHCLSRQGLPLPSLTDGETEAQRSLLFIAGMGAQCPAPCPILPLRETGVRPYFISKGPVPRPRAYQECAK